MRSERTIGSNVRTETGMSAPSQPVPAREAEGSRGG